MAVGDTITLTAKIEPAGVATKLTWTSTPDAVVEVVPAADGLTAKITAKAPSSATTTITVKTENGKEAKFVVSKVDEVTDPDPDPDQLTGIEITPRDTTITVGQTVEYTATPIPANATDYVPVWSSGNTAVATVSQAGLVTAVSVGTAYIKVASGNIADSVLVTVAPLAPGKLEKIEAKLSRELPYHEVSTDRQVLFLGDTITLFATPYPANAIDYELRWESHHPEQVSVDDNGVVTAVGVGGGNIVAVSGSGDDIIISDPIQLIVVAPLTDITLSPADESHTLSVGNGKKITASPVPAEPYDGYTPKWSSDNTAVATVDNEGFIVAKSVGTAIITVTSGSVSKSVTITVEENNNNYVPETDENGKYLTTGWTAEANSYWIDQNDNNKEHIPANVFDGDINTKWHSDLSNPLPQCLIVDMQTSVEVDHIDILNNENNIANNWVYYGTINIYLVNEPVNPNITEPQASWGEPIANYNFDEIGQYEARITLNTQHSQGRYLILFFPDSRAESGQAPYLGVDELEVYKLNE
jgi:uncharacterized protein YjdB